MRSSRTSSWKTFCLPCPMQSGQKSRPTRNRRCLSKWSVSILRFKNVIRRQHKQQWLNPSHTSMMRLLQNWMKSLLSEPLLDASAASSVGYRWTSTATPTCKSPRLSTASLCSSAVRCVMNWTRLSAVLAAEA